MCEIPTADGSKCHGKDTYWIMTNREISWAGNPDMGIAPFTSRASALACAAHLPKAVRELSALNKDAWNNCPIPSADGVTVKIRHRNEEKGWDYWA